MRVLIEVVHIAIGLIAAYGIAWLAAWSYPRATDDIWLVTYVAMVAVVAMGVGPIRRAYAIDRKRLARAGRKESRHG
ncbi:MAG TPA: hypothetical protein VM662_10540 [Sphingomonas sp.]|nr:hypothetical protein [Sphingomonas sp.]